MSVTPSIRRWAYAAMFFNVVAWGMSWVNVRAVLPEVGSGQLGALRYLIASSVMLPSGCFVDAPCPTGPTGPRSPRLVSSDSVFIISASTTANGP